MNTSSVEITGHSYTYGTSYMYIGDYGNIHFHNGDPTWNGYRVPMDVWKRAYRLHLSDQEARMLYVDKWMHEHIHEWTAGTYSHPYK